MLKLKEGFILRKIAGENVVIPSGDDLDLNMMITLNDTGAFLWERIDKGADEDGLVKAILNEYDTDEKTAENAVKNFVKKLREHEFLA